MIRWLKVICWLIGYFLLALITHELEVVLRDTKYYRVVYYCDEAFMMIYVVCMGVSIFRMIRSISCMGPR